MLIKEASIIEVVLCFTSYWRVHCPQTCNVHLMTLELVLCFLLESFTIRDTFIQVKLTIPITPLKAVKFRSVFGIRKNYSVYVTASIPCLLSSSLIINYSLFLNMSLITTVSSLKTTPARLACLCFISYYQPAKKLSENLWVQALWVQNFTVDFWITRKTVWIMRSSWNSDANGHL